jgi:hypothetical protein
MSQAVYYGQELINQNHLILNKTLELLVSKYSNQNLTAFKTKNYQNSKPDRKDTVKYSQNNFTPSHHSQSAQKNSYPLKRVTNTACNK